MIGESEISTEKIILNIYYLLLKWDSERNLHKSMNCPVNPLFTRKHIHFVVAGGVLSQLLFNMLRHKPQSIYKAQTQMFTSFHSSFVFLHSIPIQFVN